MELAAYEPDSGYGDGAGLQTIFLPGLAIWGLVTCRALRARPSALRGVGHRGVTTDQGDIDAPVVVSATGPWTRPFVSEGGYDLPIEPEYHQVAILKNAADMRTGGCACIDSVTADLFPSGRARQISGG